MVAAMARGWARSGRAPERMLFTDAGSGRAEALAAEVGGEAVASNAELAKRSDLLALGVKPKDLHAVAGEAQDAAAVLSMLGATPVERVAAAFPSSAAMRVMPNLGVEVGAGVICFSAASGVDDGLSRRVADLLRSLGRVEEMDDELIDLATAAMGCTPAYLALVVDAIASATVGEGLDSELARSLVVDTAAGTAELLRTRTPEELITAVASPGGSTEAGLEALEREGARQAFAAAVAASLARMRGDA